MEQTKIIFDNKSIEYSKSGHSVLNKDNLFILWIIIFVIYSLSVLYSLLINFEWKPLKTLEKFKRIKKNMNSWANIVNEKTDIEVNKGKTLVLTNPSISEFHCIDFGNYYAAGRISPNTYLPEFIRRGKSGPWM